MWNYGHHKISGACKLFLEYKIFYFFQESRPGLLVRYLLNLLVMYGLPPLRKLPLNI